MFYLSICSNSTGNGALVGRLADNQEQQIGKAAGTTVRSLGEPGECDPGAWSKEASKQTGIINASAARSNPTGTRILVQRTLSFATLVSKGKPRGTAVSDLQLMEGAGCICNAVEMDESEASRGRCELIPHQSHLLQSRGPSGTREGPSG